MKLSQSGPWIAGVAMKSLPPQNTSEAHLSVRASLNACRGRGRRPVGRPGLVADRRVVEDERAQPRMIGRERNEQPATHAVPDRGGARGIGAPSIDAVLPR